MIEISTDKSKLQLHVIHSFITQSYWGKGRNLKEVKQTIAHSFCFGMYKDKQQIGFVRVLTDFTVYAYLMDVFILEQHRGNGYSKQLMKAVMQHPKLLACKTWMLKTKDAHGLYKQFGFATPVHPEKLMELIK